ncbi:F-box/kelch-repeat protein At3g23880-like [Lycium ferocissimum]|uniref:F-box/kelch-repeat protein At3g23880-like n=1 Tax=Lycium ferocissimum TaxID=112874 RepID=UPI0028158386|nr:F-box/kelch-repeat protein At3g23880-like [Lycium ferocissimum]
MASRDIRPKQSKTTNPTLPPELITEILSRLPVKSLLKFRSVSKSWLSLISTPQFINTHLILSTSNNNKDYTHHMLTLNITAPTYSLYEYSLQDITLKSLFYESVTEPLDLDYPMQSNGLYKKLHNYLWIVGSVNGLICLAIEKYDLVLWNPSIRKYKKLPDSRPTLMKADCCPLYGFGYDEFHDDYKVVGVFLKYGGDQVEVKIYSLQSDSWKSVDDRPTRHLLNISGKFVNGKLYWVTCRDIFNMYKDWNIISIDLADEKWGKVEQPSYGEGYFELKLGVFGSDLSVLCDNLVTHVDVWVMKEYGVKESWTKMFTIKYPDDPFVDYDYLFFPPSFISSKGEILVYFGSSKYMTCSTSHDRKSYFMTYNPKDDSFRFSEVTNIDGWRWAEIYVESLVCPLSTEGTKNVTKTKAGKAQIMTTEQQIT